VPAAPAREHFDVSVVVMVALRFQWLFSVSAQAKSVEGNVDIRGLLPLLALAMAPGWGGLSQTWILPSR
jgi:hypothetical protein